MTFKELEQAFQDHITEEACWNIPTALRMSLVSQFNQLRESEQSDADKVAGLYALLQEALTTYPSTEMETSQLLSLQSFRLAHQRVWFRPQAKKALLHDVLSLGLVDAVPA